MTKTKAHKHTTNIINQAIITYYCYSHHNMHAHLSTQITRKLRYYGLICCGGVHENYIHMWKDWRNQGYTKHWLNTGCIWTDT